ncbi:hypothetical protein RJ639_024737 [Escallonia herrerae]|uniref:Uncharacterized protein n=1 Tax=Escallonia herrerae TaxID=1293975 RepID=A0AA88UTR4_9ASTE|nr:hypothetical protein RJ639_024737 [Escallonia herrerae]
MALCSSDFDESPKFCGSFHISGKEEKKPHKSGLDIDLCKREPKLQVFSEGVQIRELIKLVLPYAANSTYFANKYTKSMAQAAANDTGKKLIRIDISSDSVCPWCFVGKKNLDKAIASSKDQFDFKGVNKKEFYRSKFGSRSEQIVSRMTEVFRGLGLEYNMSGLTYERKSQNL